MSLNDSIDEGPGPGPSCQSTMSERSTDRFIDFKDQQSDAAQSIDEGPGPGPSCQSTMSERSTDRFVDFKDQQSDAAQSIEEGPGPGPSCQSMMSERSADRFIDFKDQPDAAQRFDHQSKDFVKYHSVLQDRELISEVFQLLEGKLITFVKEQLKRFQESLINPEICAGQTNVKEEEPNSEAFRKITVDFLRKMDWSVLADFLQSNSSPSICKQNVRNKLKQKFQCVFEGIPKPGQPTLLEEIFTTLYMTEGGTGQVNDEHEVRQIETVPRSQFTPETTIRQEDIFKPTPGRNQPIRTVMTKGVAGIGKTILTQKFTLDWAEGRTNKDIEFTFPFTFRELNVLKDKMFSLVELVHYFFVETKEAGLCSFKEFSVVFIFDGLDECRLPLDFHCTNILTDVCQTTTVDVLLINLIRGNLLPSARLWITTRPAAASLIPSGYVDQVTEVRGFTDPQKEEYFRKRFKDETQASTIIGHIKKSRTLLIMCHIPVFCWITATVLEDFLKTGDMQQLPKTLTEVYIHFLVVQTKLRNTKYDGGAEADSFCKKKDVREMIMSLGKLAFEQLQTGNLIFYESDLKQSQIDITSASMYSGFFTQIFKEEKGLYQDKVFCFVHLSMQEFMAALHAHRTFITSGVNLLSAESSPSQTVNAMLQLYQSAVDKALESPNGHLDLFLRFLLGLSLPASQSLLKDLLPTAGSSQIRQSVIGYIKEKISRSSSGDRSINLFHCLNELNDSSLVEEIQKSLSSGQLSTSKLSPAQWSALVFISLSSDRDLDEFDLKKYSASEEALLRLLPVVKVSQKALLSGCNLSERTCEVLSSVLSSKSSSLRELDLSNNKLLDPGVELLSVGLKSPNCTLKTLRLSVCDLSERSCEVLSSVLCSKSSSLSELDLSNNDLKDSGVNQLSAGLGSPHCSLETLRLSGCLITEVGCASLAKALSSNPLYLRELDLSYNHPGASGVKQLSTHVKDPQSKLQTLCVEPQGEQWLRPGLQKYSCELTFDTNTVNRRIHLSNNNRTAKYVREDQPYDEHPDRFDIPQLLCSNCLTGRCYWEVELRGKDVKISVSYRGISRRNADSMFGGNKQSWSLSWSKDGYSVHHNGKRRTTSLYGVLSRHQHAVRKFIFYKDSSDRVAVYLDHTEGVLSFYRVQPGKLSHLCTINTTFTEPLYPGFGFMTEFDSVTLCSL